MKVIRLESSIYEIVTEYPEIKDVLYDLGFREIVKPGMVQTLGKFMTLGKGSVAKNIDLSVIITRLESAGFTIDC